ncbi:hypothetical protein AB0C59_21470 [Streptomyces sp. NPDC048664]|uniref:hypothetical protein n=1 Tax=Streptomyces sp. NPDC048664 TaxID=3154505 RepID=UPI00343BBFE5
MGSTNGTADGESALVSAVRAGDTALAKRLLHENCDLAGLNAAFGLAVRMHAGTLAQLLLQYGADPGQCGPDELLSLREAVDSGSPALVEALLDHRFRDRYSASELSEVRSLAFHRHEVGLEAELRRRTGSQDALICAPVEDDEFTSVNEFTLGGITVKDGHGAILTHLEELLDVRPEFEVLMARALDHGQGHATWARSTIRLACRAEQAIWSAAAALRTHSSPSRRLFGAEVMRLTHLFDTGDENAFAGPALDIFTKWSAEETDLTVLIEVLTALGEHADPRAYAALLPYTGHSDPRIRGTVARGLSSGSEPSAYSAEVRDALMVLMTDIDTAVRRDACLTVGDGRDRDPVLADALAARLDDVDRQVQVAAVYGLAMHEDERCVEAARCLGPPQPGTHSEERCLEAAWRYEWRRDGL